jgi:hypothetical protein
MTPPVIADTGGLLRALTLDATFRQLELGLADGTVAAVAERREVFRVLTTDRRDFGLIRVGPIACGRSNWCRQPRTAPPVSAYPVAFAASRSVASGAPSTAQ